MKVIRRDRGYWRSVLGILEILIMVELILFCILIKIICLIF